MKFLKLSLITLLFISITTSWVIWSPHARAADFKVGALLNYTDGEKLPVLAYELKNYKGVAFDLWGTELDELSDGITADFTLGIGASYKLPLEFADNKLALSVGYGIGAKRPFDNNEAEFIHGAYILGLEMKF